MKVLVEIGNRNYSVNMAEAIDLSIPLQDGLSGPKCFHAPDFAVEPVVWGDFVGDIKQGGNLNFKNIKLNPHGNGTHTECVGHIADVDFTVNEIVPKHFLLADIITVWPEQINGDRIITQKVLNEWDKTPESTAVIFRTMPNEDNKKRQDYSNANPPYVDHELISNLIDQGMDHLLTDLPSVDREEDDGKLLGHKALWQYPETINQNRTITEMIFVPNEVKDGQYLLQFQLPPISLDAVPSRPIIYPILTPR